MRVAYSATPCGGIKTIGAWARAQSFALLLTAASLLLVSLVVSIAALALLLPLFGISLLIVMAADRMLLPCFPAARHWLGLTPRAA
jgi:hypothetical protein